MQTLHIYVVKNLLSTPNFVALENGYWADQGLDVQMKLTGGGRMVVQALQAGDAQLGHVAISGTLPIARAGGDNLISVMPYYNDPAYMGRASAYAIIGRKDRGVDAANPASLLGKKIGFTAGTDEYYLRQWFRRQKLDISQGPASSASWWRTCRSRISQGLGRCGCAVGAICLADCARTRVEWRGHEPGRGRA